MWGSVLCVLGAALAFVCCMNDEKFVKGQWCVQSLVPCPNEEQYRYKAAAKKNKMNRTHDWFHATMNLPEEVTALTHGLHIEICKRTDGGCKPQYQLDTPSFCNFAKDYSESNFRSILSNMGVDNSDCPIPKGDWEIKDFPFNYKDLPNEAIPGEYSATGYITKGQERVMCISIESEFIELDDEDD